MQPQELEALIAKAQNGELTQEEEIQLLKEMNLSYDVLNKFLENLKIEQLKSEI